jgi:hypothetical protein
MALEISPNDRLPDVVRLTDFSTTVTASFTEGESTTIVSVSAELAQGVDSGLRFTPGTDSVTISGKHVSGFTDILTYVDKGQSDKTQAPKKATGIENMPAGQTLFDLNQDRNQKIDRTFKIIVKLSDDSQQIFNLTQTVQNDLESIRAFMGSYFK